MNLMWDYYSPSRVFLPSLEFVIRKPKSALLWFLCAIIPRGKQTRVCGRVDFRDPGVVDGLWGISPRMTHPCFGAPDTATSYVGSGSGDRLPEKPLEVWIISKILACVQTVWRNHEDWPWQCALVLYFYECNNSSKKGSFSLLFKCWFWEGLGWRLGWQLWVVHRGRSGQTSGLFHD